MLKSIFLPILGVMFFIVFTGLLYQGKLNFLINKDTINTTTNPTNMKTIKIEEIEIKVETAKSNSERSKGLSNRESLDQDSGMVFIFDENTKPVFWMKDTKIALDIIWINDNKIIGINKNVQPEPGVADGNLTKYSAPSDVDYVLEVNAGFSDKNDIKVGQMISGLEQL